MEEEGVINTPVKLVCWLYTKVMRHVGALTRSQKLHFATNLTSTFLVSPNLTVNSSQSTKLIKMGLRLGLMPFRVLLGK